MLRATTTIRRPLQVAVVALVAGLVLAGCLTANQTTVVSQINATRKSSRVANVKADTGASSKAQKWSDHMARTGVLEHTGGGNKLDSSGLTNACGVAENVGMGPSLERVHAAFLASPTHKANILGGYHRVGIGVTVKGGTYWVTEIFIKNCR